MDTQKIQKLNKLAKTLKDTGMAPSMDDAVKMAEGIIQEGETEIKKLAGRESKELLIAEAVHEEGFVDKVKEKVKELIGDVEEKELPKEDVLEESEEEEKKEPFILKKLGQKSEEIQEEISDIEKKEDCK